MALPYDKFLFGTMVVSWIWGFFVFITGCFVLSNTAVSSSVEDFVKDVDNFAGSMSATLKNADNKSIIPYLTKVPGTVSWHMGGLGLLTILVGAAIVMFSVFGAFAALRKSQFVLYALVSAIFWTMVVEGVLLILMAGTDTKLHLMSKASLKDRLDSFKVLGASDFDKVLNAVMMAGKCCGIEGPKDFPSNITYQGPYGYTYGFVVAPACCDLSSLTKDVTPVMAHQLLLDCAAKEDDEKSFFQQGCYDKVHKYVADELGALIVTVSVLFIVWQVMQMTLAILITRAQEISRKEIERRLTEEALRISMAKFHPYSKVASTPSDASRAVGHIPSTEVW